MQIDALVLAGGINRIALFEGYHPGLKALLSYAGKPSIQYTIDALQAIPRVRRIGVVGPPEELRESLADPSSLEFVPGGDTLLESIRRGLSHFHDSPLILVTTADLPLLRAPMVEEFLDASPQVIESGRFSERFFLAMVPEESFSGPFREAAKGFQRFRDVAVCHGNLALVTPTLTDHLRVTRRIEAIYRARKNSIRTTLAFGPRVGLCYTLGAHFLRLLSLQRMAGIASSSFHVEMVPVLLPYPEVTIDVDEPKDYRFVREMLEGSREQQK